MEALEYRIDHFIVLELRDRVDEFNTEVLRDEIHTIINTGRCRLAIDLSKTEFLSAHCLSAVWNCQRRARRMGGDIVLCAATGSVLETISFVKLNEVLRCFDDMSSVREYFSDFQVAKQAAEGLQTQEQGAGTLPFLPRFIEACKRFFQFVLVAVFCNLFWFHSLSARANEDHRYTLEELTQLAVSKGAFSIFSDLKKQERLQDLEMAKSLQLPSILLTTGYLYQSNPNLLTQVANREINQLRQQGSDSEISSFQSSSNFKIEKDVVVVSVGVVQALYTGGLYDSRIRLVQSQVREEEAKSVSDSLQIKETVQKLYLGILLTEKKIDLLDAKLNAAVAKKKAMTQAGDEKVVGTLKISESELSELMSTQNLLEAKQENLKLRENLNALIGKEPDETLKLADVSLKKVKKISEPQDYLKIAESRYPELTYAASRIDTAKAYEETLNASAVRSPKAFLLGGVDHTRGIGNDDELLNWTVGVALTMPLYDGGRSFAEMEKSRLLLSQARLGYSEAKRKLYRDLRDAVSRLKEADLKLTIAQKARQIATQRVEAARDAVEKKQVPSYELAESKIADIESKIAILAAESEYLDAAAKLSTLIGEPDL